MGAGAAGTQGRPQGDRVVAATAGRPSACMVPPAGFAVLDCRRLHLAAFAVGHQQVYRASLPAPEGCASYDVFEILRDAQSRRTADDAERSQPRERSLCRSRRVGSASELRVARRFNNQNAPAGSPANGERTRDAGSGYASVSGKCSPLQAAMDRSMGPQPPSWVGGAVGQ
jgi:hypothetical protein